MASQVSGVTDRALFARLVREGKEKSGKSWPQVASGLGISDTHLKQIAYGNRFPADAVASDMAEYFALPSLLEIMARVRSRACSRCGAAFHIGKHQAKQLYCSADCQNRVDYERKAERIESRRVNSERLVVHIRNELISMTARVQEQSSAIAAFCHACEPGGICRMGECEMREVSPLPLVSRKEVVA